MSMVAHPSHSLAVSSLHKVQSRPLCIFYAHDVPYVHYLHFRPSPTTHVMHLFQKRGVVSSGRHRSSYSSPPAIYLI